MPLCGRERIRERERERMNARLVTEEEYIGLLDKKGNRTDEREREDIGLLGHMKSVHRIAED